MFLTGMNEFRRLDAWPPKTPQSTTFYFDAGRQAVQWPAASKASTNTSAIPQPPSPIHWLIGGGMTDTT